MIVVVHFICLLFLTFVCLQEIIPNTTSQRQYTKPPHPRNPLTSGTAIAGVRVHGAGGRSGPRPGEPEARLGSGGGLALDVRPRGEVVVGLRGTTLRCSASGGPGSTSEVRWLYNGRAAPPCGTERCNLLQNGSLRVYKVRLLLRWGFFFCFIEALGLTFLRVKIIVHSVDG